MDLANRFGNGCASAIKTGPTGVETTPRSPLPEPFDRLARRDGDGHNMLGRSPQREVEQGRQAAARANLGTSPVAIVGSRLIGGKVEPIEIDSPDPILLSRSRKIEKEHGVEPLGPDELGRELADIIGRADEEHVGFMVVEPREQGSKQSRAHA